MDSGSRSTYHLHTSNDSGAFKGFPGRKLVTLICPGKQKWGFGECERCPYLCGSAGQGKETDGVIVPPQGWKGDDTGWLLGVGLGQVSSTRAGHAPPIPQDTADHCRQEGGPAHTS